MIHCMSLQLNICMKSQFNWHNLTAIKKLFNPHANWHEGLEYEVCLWVFPAFARGHSYTLRHL